MENKKSLLGTVWLITSIFFFLLAALIFLSEISFHKRNFQENIVKAEESYYREQRENLKNEVNRILLRVEFQKSAVSRLTKEQVKSRSLEGYGLTLDLYEKGNHCFSQEDLQREILTSLRGLSYFDGAGYYFVIGTDGIILMNKSAPEKENRAVSSLEDREREVLQGLLSHARQNGSDYYSYEWYEPDNPEIWLKKLVYYKVFEPYGWIIGTGLFEEDISRSLQKGLLNSIDYVFSDKPDHIFIGDTKGNMLLGSHRGVNYLESGDRDKIKLYEDILATAQEGGFLEYQIPHSLNDNGRRLSYIGKVEGWNWFIGTVISTNELEREINLISMDSQRELRRELAHLSLIVLILFVILILFFTIIKKFFNQDLYYFSRFFKQASTENIPIQKEKIRFREFYDLSDYANKMVEEKKRGDREKQRRRNLESLSFLAAGIAHDFNNALMGIFGNVELAQRCVETEEDPLPFLDRALEAMEYTRRITARLLTFAEGGHPSFRKISLKSLIDTTVEQWMEEESRPPVIREIPEGTTIQGDANQLNLAFSFLLANAFEAAEPRSAITIHAEKMILTRAFPPRLSGHYVRIDIIDRGEGMDEETLEKVFDPYFSTKRTGRGLGIPTVFSIIKHHRGYTDIRSETGKGTTVSLYIPEGEDS